MDDQIKAFLNSYLDSMPPASRVTMDDLAWHAHKTTGFNLKAVREIIRDVVYARADFVVNRGKGCIKRG